MDYLLVGNRSRRAITGMTLAFEMLIERLERQATYSVIDKGVGNLPGRSGELRLRRLLSSLGSFLNYLRKLPTVDTVYLLIGQTRMAFLRDGLMICAAALLSKRTVVHLHGGGFQDLYFQSPTWMRFFMRKVLTQVSVFIVLGEALRDQFSFVPGALARTQVVPNGLPDNLQAVSLPRKKGVPLRLLYLSNMIESKGYLDVLAACRILAKQHDFRCDFCGAFTRTVVNGTSVEATEAEAQFFDLVKKWGLENFVSYKGVVRDREKMKVLAESDVFLLPSSYPWEGQPLSIIEALAFGIPVVATDYRGIPEQVIDGYNGRMVPPRDPTAIAEAVDWIVSDAKRYAALSEAAISHYKSHFTQEVHLERLIGVLMNDKPSCSSKRSI